MNTTCFTAGAPLAVPSVSPFAQNVIDTLREIDVLPEDGQTEYAIRVLERPYAEISHHFAQTGEGWMGIAGRFHETITQGLKVEDIPLGIHAFFRDTFFSEHIALARFELYFKAVADVLREEITVEKKAVENEPSRKPESGIRKIYRASDSDDAPTLRSGELIELGIGLEVDHPEPSPSDTIPAPAPWLSDTESHDLEPNNSRFVANIVSLLEKYQVIPTGATLEAAVDALNNPYGDIFIKFVRCRLPWMGIGAYFHQEISRDMKFEEMPVAVHKFFGDLYFMDFSKHEFATGYGAYEDKFKFESYFAILASLVSEEITGEKQAIQMKSANRPRSGTWPTLADPHIDLTASTPRVPEAV